MYALSQLNAYYLYELLLLSVHHQRACSFSSVLGHESVSVTGPRPRPPRYGEVPNKALSLSLSLSLMGASVKLGSIPLVMEKFLINLSLSLSHGWSVTYMPRGVFVYVVVTVYYCRFMTHGVLEL